MPDYTVKVTYTYPIQAVSAEDALSTVPIVIKGRFIGFHGEGLTEIINAEGEVVLKAELAQRKEDYVRTKTQADDRPAEVQQSIT